MYIYIGRKAIAPLDISGYPDFDTLNDDEKKVGEISLSCFFYMTIIVLNVLFRETYDVD